MDVRGGTQDSVIWAFISVIALAIFLVTPLRQRKEATFVGHDGKENKESQRSGRHNQERPQQIVGTTVHLQGFKFIFSYLWRKGSWATKLSFIISCFTVVLTRIIKVVKPYCLGQTLERIQSGSTTLLCWPVVTWFLCLYAESDACLLSIDEWASYFWIPDVSSQMEYDAREHVINLSMDFHKRKRHDEIDSEVINGAENALNLVVHGLFKIFPIILDLFVAIWRITHEFDVSVACGIIVPCIVYIYMLRTVTYQAHPQFIELTEASQRKQHTGCRLVCNQAQARTSGRKSLEMDNYRKSQEHYTLHIREYISIQVRAKASRHFLLLLGLVYSMYRILGQASSGPRSVGKVIQLYDYWRNLTVPLPELAASFLAWDHSRHHLERFFGLLNEKPTVVDGVETMSLPVGKPCKVELENVEFRYLANAESWNLDKINLTVERGQRVAIVGTSGAGKTCLLHLIRRFYDPCKGKVLVNDQDLRRIRQTDVYQCMAYVMQGAQLPDGSVLDVLRHDRDEPERKDVEDLCRRLGIHDEITSAPAGYDSVIGGKGGLELSGGQAQRLVLAQALLRKPHILLIDEVTSHLDSKSQDAVVKELDRVKEFTTVIMTAHRLRTCIEADNIVVMKAGKIIEQGKHKSLLELKGEYWNLWQSESKEIDKTLEV